MRTWIRIMLAAAMLAPVSALAQSDASAPKAAVKAFYAAVQKGDANAISQVLLLENDPQQELARAYAGLILAGKQLGDAAKAKYPGVSNMLAQGTIAPEDAAKIDSASVTVTGDTVVLKPSPTADPLTLRKVNDTWRVVIDTGDDAKPENLSQRLALIRGLSDAMKESAKEVAEDKYVTAQDAENAVKLRLGSVLSKALQSNLPTSKPTTKP